MKVSTSINFLFREQPFFDRFQAAADAGFDGVEIQVLEGAPLTCADKAKAAGIPVVLLNVDMGDLLQGGPGLSGVPGQEAHFQDAVKQAVAAADVMGAPYIHLGPSKVPEGVERSTCKATYVSNLEAIQASGIMKSSHAKLLIEPMNNVDMPDALFTDFDEVAEVIKSGFDDFLGLQFDIYHVCKNGQDPVAVFKKHAALIDHVQFSDLPNRAEPGAGTLDFEPIITAILANGYDGYFGAEYFPQKPSLETLGWLGTFKQMINHDT